MDMTIPFAASLDDSCQALIPTLKLVHLAQYIRASKKTVTSTQDEFDFTPPHEQGWVSNQIEITPCHWLIGIDNIRMGNPSDLALTAIESQTLLEAMRPYFLADGILLQYEEPLRWTAEFSSPSLIPLGSLASLDRVIGRNVEAWLPPLPAGRMIRRLQNEMQMLLYTHPINEARSALGQATVNSFWISHAINPNTSMLTDLRAPALAGDWQTWCDTWHKLDQLIGRDFQAIPRMTLCGERQSITFYKDWPLPLQEKIMRLFQAAPRLQSILSAL